MRRLTTSLQPVSRWFAGGSQVVRSRLEIDWTVEAKKNVGYLLGIWCNREWYTNWRASSRVIWLDSTY